MHEWKIPPAYKTYTVIHYLRRVRKDPCHMIVHNIEKYEEAGESHPYLDS